MKRYIYSRNIGDSEKMRATETKTETVMMIETETKTETERERKMATRALPWRPTEATKKLSLAAKDFEITKEIDGSATILSLLLKKPK